VDPRVRTLAHVLYSLVYVSSATTLFSQSELDEILALSHRNNALTGISGILLYKDGNLMQVLEGEEAKVRSLYDTIAADRRHKGLILLWEGFEETRQFPGWSMAFRNLNGADAAATPGYSEFLNVSLTSPELVENPSVAQKLLMTFRDSM